MLVSSSGKFRCFEHDFEGYYSNNKFAVLQVDDLPDTEDSRDADIISRNALHSKMSEAKINVKKVSKQRLGKQNSFLEINRVNMFGRETNLVSDKRSVSRLDIKRHVETCSSKLIKSKWIITCNGKSNLKIANPSDKIRVGWQRW